MIRILHVLPRMPLGGVGAFLIEAQKNINREEYIFDYLVIEDTWGSTFSAVVEEMGSKVFLLNDILSFSNAIRIQNDLDNFFRIHAKEYDILHLHSANVGMMVLPIAQKNGINVRILHAHSTKYSDSPLKSARNWAIERPVLHYCTNLIACSKSAGDFQFKNHPYDVVYNGINIDKYKYLPFKSNAHFIIGHVGNFVPVKNHVFLVNLIDSLKTEGFDCELWFAGTGLLEGKIRDKVNQKGLKDRVKFLGRVDHTENFYNQIDLFVLPSFYEGFPVSLMEAQACGTPVMCSERITKEVDFYGDCVFLPIDKTGIKKWSKAILGFERFNREEKAIAFQNSQFSVKSTISELEKLYTKYIK